MYCRLHTSCALHLGPNVQQNLEYITGLRAILNICSPSLNEEPTWIVLVLFTELHTILLPRFCTLLSHCVFSAEMWGGGPAVLPQL
jgi:hypothetical protein